MLWQDECIITEWPSPAIKRHCEHQTAAILTTAVLHLRTIRIHHDDFSDCSRLRNPLHLSPYDFRDTNVKNITIAKKLIFLVCIALVSLAFVGIGATYQMQSAQKRFETVQATVIPAIVLLSETGAASAAIRAAVRDYIIGGFLDDQAMKKVQIANLERLKAQIAKNLSLYEKDLISNDEDKSLLEKDRKALEAYLAEVNDVFAKVESKDVAGLSQQFSEKGNFRVTAVALIKSFSDHAMFSEKLADSLKKSGAEEYSKSMTLLITVSAIAFVILGGLGLILIRGIRSSLGQMQSAMGSIKDNLDFTIRADNTREDEVGHTGQALNELLEKLQNNLSSISERAKSVSVAAGQMATTSGQVATASHQQSEAASNMAATVEELTVSINHVGDRAQEADRISIESGNLAKSGEAIIGRTVEDIHRISTKVNLAAERIRELVANSEQISNVIAVIKEVADQTNLLALNAAIEAARAGEQGRGFAVVADEVRKLAERTAKSTKEISETINTMRSGAGEAATSMESVVTEVSQGVESAKEASQAINRIGAGSRETVEMVEEISGAIREQASAMNSIAQQVERIAQMSEESSAAADSSSQVAKDLDRLATDVQQIISAYKL